MPRPRLWLLALLLALPGLAGCLEETPPPAPQADPEAEAIAFSLRVVASYFNASYDEFRALLADDVYALEGGAPIPREEIDAWAREESPFPDGRDYRNRSMEEYLDTYAPRVLTFEEGAAEHPGFNETRWDGWVPDEDDLIFIGWETKPGREGFLWDDLLAFAVSKESGEWRFKAFSG